MKEILVFKLSQAVGKHYFVNTLKRLKPLFLYIRKVRLKALQRIKQKL